MEGMKHEQRILNWEFAFILTKVTFRSSRQEVFCKKGVLKNFAIFTGKRLCWTLFNKVTGLQACNFIMKRLQHICFPVNIVKFLRTTILKKICKRLLSKILGTLIHSNLSKRNEKSYNQLLTAFLTELW